MSTAGRALAAGAGVLVVLLLAPILMIGALIGGVTGARPNASAIDAAQLPPHAAPLLPELERVVQTRCPELPLVFAAAHIQAESSWNPRAYNSSGRAAGLYQFQEPTWTYAGGAPWPTDPPPPEAAVFNATHHLEIAVPWVCTNLRQVSAHLADTGKPADPLDALLVCHIAGCSRVTSSATGVPTAGEAGCDAACADTIREYIAAVHDHAQRIAAPSGSAALDGLPAPAPFTGPSAGCTEPDPSGTGCLSPHTRHALEETLRAFGRPGPNSPIRSYTCWDQHAWNPSSDHPRGRACDFFPAQAGAFPAGQELADGWRLAEWLRTHAAALRVRYIIWQGRFWSPTTPDDNGWGRPYSGGGIYDVEGATGGHYDHIHLSIG